MKCSSNANKHAAIIVQKRSINTFRFCKPPPSNHLFECPSLSVTQDKTLIYFRSCKPIAI